MKILIYVQQSIKLTMKYAKAFLVFSILVASIVAIVAISVASATATPAVTNVQQLPSFGTIQNLKMSYSTNWAGYAVGKNLLIAPGNNTVTEVSGSWVVASVNPAATPQGGVMVCWVGIDGYSSDTVEQIGTMADAGIPLTSSGGSLPFSACANGAPTGSSTGGTGGSVLYLAWYEMYPNPPVVINMLIRPGDVMWGDVRYLNNGMFLLTIVDQTRHEEYSTLQTMYGAERSSAEWIVEAPALTDNTPLPLADFGKVTFTNAQATLGGQTGSINYHAWQYDAITMNSSSTDVLAKVSPLSYFGSSFQVTWVNSS